ncbi:uncharacterized protein LOC117187164 [Drosophila miranda]|uniref:uncharacterized protein LOC117187164 n=1 Tax=Drosophila miranda TaxID=7229 RepID=UPI00143FAF8F|nr:uncharacterized protein LOC117187164 [Drosophila miranda]
MVKALPLPIQNIIFVPKNQHLENLKMETEFLDQVYKLEEKYRLFVILLFSNSGDFTIGHFLRVRIIPKAVIFTGDIVDDEKYRY